MKMTFSEVDGLALGLASLALVLKNTVPVSPGAISVWERGERVFRVPHVKLRE